jgi:hypothetical protein
MCRCRCIAFQGVSALSDALIVVVDQGCLRLSHLLDPYPVIEPWMPASCVFGVWCSFERRAIGKAEFPGLPRLEGLNEGVVVLTPMLTGVTVLRVVATTDYTAGKAGSEMNPGVALCDAPFTDV